MPAKIRVELVSEYVITPCWIWTGCLNSKGYGCVGIDKKIHLTHRVAYEAYCGQIPDGLQIDHLCFNRKCCNPDHLDAVTGKVNSERSREATKTRCKQGHPLAGPNVRMKTKGSAGTQRQCQVCMIDYSLRQSQRNRKTDRAESPARVARREAKRAWLIEAGEVALAAFEQQQMEAAS